MCHNAAGSAWRRLPPCQPLLCTVPARHTPSAAARVHLRRASTALTNPSWRHCMPPVSMQLACATARRMQPAAAVARATVVQRMTSAHSLCALLRREQEQRAWGVTPAGPTPTDRRHTSTRRRGRGLLLPRCFAPRPSHTHTLPTTQLLQRFGRRQRTATITFPPPTHEHFPESCAQHHPPRRVVYRGCVYVGNGPAEFVGAVRLHHAGTATALAAQTLTTRSR